MDASRLVDRHLEQTASERRMQLQQELLDEACHYLQRKRDIPVVFQDDEANLVLHHVWEDGQLPLTLCEVKVLDILPD